MDSSISLDAAWATYRDACLAAYAAQLEITRYDVQSSYPGAWLTCAEAESAKVKAWNTYLRIWLEQNFDVDRDDD